MELRKGKTSTHSKKVLKTIHGIMNLIKRTDDKGDVQYLEQRSVVKLVFVSNKFQATSFTALDADRLIKFYQKKEKDYTYTTMQQSH